MSEKLRPNFTPVPNVILDEIMRGLNEGEFKTLMAICRYTYGWGKKSDRISLSQLAEITGISDRSNVHRAIKRLGSLIVITRGDPSKNLASEYRINVDIADDLLSQKQQDLLSHRQQPVVRPVVSRDNFQRKPKKEERGTIVPHSLKILSHSKKEKHTRPAPDDRVKPFLIWFAEEYEKRMGGPYAVGWGKDSKLIKELPAAFDLPRLKDLAVRFFESPDPWVRQNGGFTVGVFISQINKLTSTGANGNGQAKPTQVTELGNGMVEVDGVQMDRRTYERRHGQHANA